MLSADHLHGVLVGLNDREGYTLGLGILCGIDPEAGRITVFTPVRDVTRIRALQFGSIRLDTEGRELGPLPGR